MLDPLHVFFLSNKTSTINPFVTVILISLTVLNINYFFKPILALKISILLFPQNKNFPPLYLTDSRVSVR